MRLKWCSTYALETRVFHAARTSICMPQHHHTYNTYENRFFGILPFEGMHMTLYQKSIAAKLTCLRLTPTYPVIYATGYFNFNQMNLMNITRNSSAFFDEVTSTIKRLKSIFSFEFLILSRACLTCPWEREEYLLRPRQSGNTDNWPCSFHYTWNNNIISRNVATNSREGAN